LRDQKNKKLLDPTQLAQGRHHQTNNLRERERERERERSDAKRASAELMEFSAFQKHKDFYILSGSCELHVWIENN
jgi:hypothetical protein